MSRMWRNWNSCVPLMGIQIGVTTNKKRVWRFLKKIKNRTTKWSSNSISVYWFKEHENTNLKNIYIYMHPHVHCSIIDYSLDIETTYMSTDEWMGREDVIYLSVYR